MADEAIGQAPTSPTIVSDYEEWERLVHENGWSDGLPVAPPTERRVTAMIDYLERDPLDVIGKIPPVYGVASIEQICIQCAMAGCIPEHVPVVIAAIEAMLDGPFNLHGVQSTTNPCAPLAIVSGPIVQALDFNVRNGVFGGGGFANAAIGRAVRLVLWNLGGGKPSVNDMSDLGQPAKYAFCVAENMEMSPWSALHTDFGYAPEDNAVTMFACQAPYPALATGAPIRILRSLAEGFTSSTVNMFHGAGQYMVVLAIKPARALAEAGYSKDDVRQFLFEHARLSVGYMRATGVLDDHMNDPTAMYWGEAGLARARADLGQLPDDAFVPLVQSVDDIRVLVTGGDTQWWAGYCPGWGNYGGYFTTRPITLPGDR